MEYIATELQGVFIIEPKVFNDERGYFLEAWKKEEFEHGKHDKEFYQDDNPQCFSPSHPSEPLGINAEKGFKCS